MLARLTRALAAAALLADGRRPVALNKRSGVAFGAGLGPHSETETFGLILAEAKRGDPGWLRELHHSVPYPSNPRQKCDTRLLTADGDLLIEAKLLRLKGDNGKPNDNMLMHILSPYPQHRSALTDCIKLSASGFSGRKAILIVGYAYHDMPLEPAISAFEMLAGGVAKLGKRCEAPFVGLCHPVHREGKVFAWEIE